MLRLYLSIISVFTAVDACAAIVLQPINATTFAPPHSNHVDMNSRSLPLSHQTARFLPFTTSQMARLHPLHTASPMRVETAAVTEEMPSNKISHVSMMDDEQAKQLLSLFDTDQ